MHEVRAVVMGKNAPVALETILVPDPGPGKALVDVLTCGVCQADLHDELGTVGDDHPYLLGHEASGVVSALGQDVTEIAVGDKLVLNRRTVCGRCRACRREEPWYGGTLPSRDFPVLVGQYRLGRLDPDGFVTERVRIAEVEPAFEKMHAGEVLRSVVESDR